MKFVVLIGSATPPGRTQAMAAACADALRARDPATDVSVIDLANVACEPADGRPLEGYDGTIQAAVRALAEAQGVVIASPVYRATYAGVLKNFLDIVPVEALRDTPVGLIVLGASPHHYLGVDNALRLVLAWYGALALPTSVYLTGGDFDERRFPTDKAKAELDGLAATLLALCGGLAGKRFEPTPLAARYTG